VPGINGDGIGIGVEIELTDDRRLSCRAPLPPHQQSHASPLRSLLAGKTAKETAESMGLSVQTINTYVKDLYAKLNIDSRGALMSRFLNHPGGRPIFLPASFEE
jgi:hypothetical protein